MTFPLLLNTVYATIALKRYNMDANKNGAPGK